MNGENVIEMIARFSRESQKIFEVTLIRRPNVHQSESSSSSDESFFCVDQKEKDF